MGNVVRIQEDKYQPKVPTFEFVLVQILVICN